MCSQLFTWLHIVQAQLVVFVILCYQVVKCAVSCLPATYSAHTAQPAVFLILCLLGCELCSQLFTCLCDQLFIWLLIAKDSHPFVDQLFAWL
jgi:hypothetical protein